MLYVLSQYANWSRFGPFRTLGETKGEGSGSAPSPILIGVEQRQLTRLITWRSYVRFVLPKFLYVIKICMGLFNDVNEVTILGNISQDVELKQTAKGTVVVSISVATNRSYEVLGEWKKETTFHSVVVWGKDAEQLSTRAYKGTRILVQGRLQTRTWEKDGQRKSKTEIVADKVILIDRYHKSESEKVIEDSSINF